MKTDIWLVAIETTEHWQPEIIEKTGRIFEVYAVDANLHTHICSFTPSLWLEFVEFYTEKETDDDIWYEVKTWAGDSDYYSLSVLKNNPIFKPSGIDFRYRKNDDEQYDELWNDVVEYYRCNSTDVGLFEKCFPS